MRGDPMPRLALLFAVLLAVAADAQNVRVTLKDGRAIEGELASFEQGRYTLLLPDGSTRHVEERAVQNIVLLDVKARPAADAAPAALARAAFDRGDYDAALRHSAQALHALDAERSGVADLSRRAGLALIESALQRRDGPGLHDHLRRIVPTLPVESRRDLLAQLAGRFGDVQKPGIEDGFTTAFAETLAHLADEGTVGAETRAPLADVFVRLAEAAAERKQWSSAATLYQGAAKVDPKRKEVWRIPAAQATLALGRRRLETGDPAGALAAARLLDARSPEVRRLLEDAELETLKQEVELDYGAAGPQRVRAFLSKSTRPEHKAWAEQALKRMSGAGELWTPDVAAQLRRYFPLKPGRWVLYRRADGEIRERIRTDAVRRDGEILRVDCTLEEIYRDHSTTRAYQVEIERDAVILPTGSDREPLLKFPLRPDDAWTWTTRGREFRRVVKSLAETVRTGERIWTDCLVVEFTSSVERDGAPVSITSRSAYAPGVGLVKLEFVDPEFRRFNLELLDHGAD